MGLGRGISESVRLGRVDMMASARRCANGSFGAAGPPGRARPMVVSPPEATFPSVQRDAPLAHLVRGGNFERRPVAAYLRRCFRHHLTLHEHALGCLRSSLRTLIFDPRPRLFSDGGRDVETWTPLPGSGHVVH